MARTRTTITSISFVNQIKIAHLIVVGLGAIGLTMGTIESRPRAMCDTEQRSWGPQPHKPRRDEFLPVCRETPKPSVGICPTDGS